MPNTPIHEIPVRPIIEAARKEIREGNVDSAKSLLQGALFRLENSPSPNPQDWEDLTAASGELAAFQLIWMSYQVAKSKTVSYREVLEKIEATSPA